MAEDIAKISTATHSTEQLLSGDTNILDQLILTFEKGLNMPIVYWQLVCIVFSLGLGWIITLGILRWLKDKQFIQKVEDIVDTTPPEDLDQEAHDVSLKKHKEYPFSKLFLQISWACFSMLFLALSAYCARLFNLLPPYSLPLEAITWLICEAYIVVRTVVFILHRSIKGIALSGSVMNIIALSIWTMVALQIIGVLPKLVDFLSTTRVPIGKENITLWSIGMAIFTIALALLVAKWIGQILERWIWSLPKVETNVRLVFIRITKIFLVFIAILIGLSSVGIDVTILGVFGGAIGVGLGFGLQKIASNYVSGFIILLERSIKIGDVVSVAGIEGTVQDIKTRYTVIRQFNGSVTIIPNESFVTGNVSNTSYLQGPGRASVTMSVDYTSDLDAVMKLMTDIVKNQPRVLENPAPSTVLSNFGNDGIDLTTYFWVADPSNGTRSLRSNISKIMLQEFDKAGIVIPYQQREIRILSVPDIVCKVETGSDNKSKNS